MASTRRDSARGQNHDRLGADDEFAMSRLVDIEAVQDDASGMTITAPQKMASASAGSLLTSLLMTPLDVVRVRLQSQKMPTSTVDFSRLALTTTTLTPAQTAELGVTACCREVFFAGNDASYCIAAPRMAAPADCAVQEVQKKTYTSTIDGMRKIARNEGVTTLWRGLSPTLAMAVPANIIYFAGYDWLRYSSKSPLSGLSSDHAPLTSGSLARIFAATAVSPIELVRTRMQAASGVGTTNHLVEAFNGIREMVGAHGYTSLWRGLTLTLWRDVPFSGIYWWGYETIRAKLTDAREEKRGRSLTLSDSPQQARLRSQSRENHTETFVDSFTAGAMSGAFASIVTMPFDVGKTRTQVYRDGSKSAVGDAAAQAPEELSMVRLLMHIFKTEGLAGLWRGWIPRTLKVAPACAIMISSYEVGKRAFRGVNERADRKHKDDM
ncbi:mitochondrial carrier protein [Purpureocillium lilacinum]|uniref:Mitochondrial carrier protein n=1 Tax=Purpureocillium lilacinum TaxID=33203 RepID=A0A179GJP8_PURLI|nr:mitochondrial carrier protein [Purpureocillium lilacinum]OAQ78032.1 mitochondrial carrier protein [Purpureocillium lilacinum]